MKTTTTALLVLATLVSTSFVARGAWWDTVLLTDDFSGGSAQGLPDPRSWVVNVPESWWWVQGQSFFPSPLYHSAATFPKVSNGVCVLEHHSYNDFDLGQAHTTFLGGQIRTVAEFAPTQAYRFEAMVKCDSYPSGLVTSFFTYGFDGVKSDEIDFEFVSKKNNDDARNDGDWVLTNTWNESRQKPTWVLVPGLDLTQWNRFRIYWYPGKKVEWTWLADPEDDKSEIVLRTETDSLYIPDEPMGLFSNIWAASSGWQEAYSPDFRPTSVPQLDQVLTFGLDDVKVSVSEPASAALLAIGLLALKCRRRHSTQAGGARDQTRRTL